MTGIAKCPNLDGIDAGEAVGTTVSPPHFPGVFMASLGIEIRVGSEQLRMVAVISSEDHVTMSIPVDFGVSFPEYVMR